VLLGALILGPLVPTFAFYNAQTRSSRTNALFFDIVARLEAFPDSTILLDASLKRGEFPSGGNLNVAWRTWLAYSARPFQATDVTTANPETLCRTATFLIAAADVVPRLSASCRVTPIVHGTVNTRPGREPLPYGLFEIAGSE
jgi:hypothetical protein